MQVYTWSDVDKSSVWDSDTLAVLADTLPEARNAATAKARGCCERPEDADRLALILTAIESTNPQVSEWER